MTTSITANEIANGHEVEEFVKYYDVEINGTKIFTTVTSNHKILHQWIVNGSYNEPSSRRIFGLDFKFNPNPNPDRIITVIALCVGSNCLIFTLSIGTMVPMSLLQFFAHNNHAFVGIAIKEKLHQMHLHFGLGGRTWYEDLGVLAEETHGIQNMRSASLDELNMYLRRAAITRPPPLEVNLWDMSYMPMEHVHHACIDVYTCYDLGFLLCSPIPGRVTTAGTRFIVWPIIRSRL